MDVLSRCGWLLRDVGRAPSSMSDADGALTVLVGRADQLSTRRRLSDVASVAVGGRWGWTAVDLLATTRCGPVHPPRSFLSSFGVPHRRGRAVLETCPCGNSHREPGANWTFWHQSFGSGLGQVQTGPSHFFRQCVFQHTFTPSAFLTGPGSQFLTCAQVPSFFPHLR